MTAHHGQNFMLAQTSICLCLAITCIFYANNNKGVNRIKTVGDQMITNAMGGA